MSDELSTEVAQLVFTTAAGGAITGLIRNERCTLAAAVAIGRYRVNLSEPIADRDMDASLTISAVGNVGGGAGLFATFTRVTDSQYEIGVFIASGTPSDAVGDLVRLTVRKFRPA